jgi:hypothetical protein
VQFFIFEVGKKDTPLKKATDVFFPPNDIGDFPTAIVVSPKTHVAYMITKFGTLYVFDLLTLGRLICMTKISSHVCFVATYHEATDGILCINTKGQVHLRTYCCSFHNESSLSLSLSLSLNANTLSRRMRQHTEFECEID